jgi:DNA-binding CsgD family transcriptional regulator
VYGQPFDPSTKCGFDADFATGLFDYHLHHVLRFAPVDIGQRITNFSFTFRNKREAGQFSGLLETIVPYLHLAILRSYGLMDDKPLHVVPQELTLRQREILKWLIEGKTGWEIGQILHIAERTVKFHVQNLMHKFGAINKHQLIANAFQKLTNIQNG